MATANCCELLLSVCNSIFVFPQLKLVTTCWWWANRVAMTFISIPLNNHFLLSSILETPNRKSKSKDPIPKMGQIIFTENWNRRLRIAEEKTAARNVYSFAFAMKCQRKIRFLWISISSQYHTFIMWHIPMRPN